jgi:hypothetical protein
MTGMRKALILACALATIATPALAVDQVGRLGDESHIQLSAFLAAGEDLYKRAAAIVHEKPKTEVDVDRIFHAMGSQWQIDEHAFQTSFWPMRDATDLPDDVREGIVRIGQFDNFVFDAVGATYQCNNANAHWTLKIAGEILAHAKMASDGHPDAIWNPDLDSVPDDKAECR